MARWGWKLGDTVYCSYRCMRIEEKARQEKQRFINTVDDLTHDQFGRHIGGDRMRSKDRKILDEICAVMVRNHMNPEKIRLIQENYVMLVTADGAR